MPPKPSRLLPKPPQAPKGSQASFTLVETVLALGIMVVVMLEVSGVQGRSITFSDYNRSMSQAIWLAKAAFAKVEWSHAFYPFKDLKLDLKEQTFSEDLCQPAAHAGACPFKYDLRIEHFPLPVGDLIAQQLGMGSSKSEDGGGAGGNMAKIVKDYLGDELLKIAHVVVHWTNGSSKRDEVALTLLLTNQKQLDEQIYQMEPLEASAEPEKAPETSKQTTSDQATSPSEQTNTAKETTSSTQESVTPVNTSE